MAAAADVVNQQKAAALAAGAQGGSAGLAAYNAAAASITGARDVALGEAARNSALIGAGHVDSTLGSMISAPVSRRLQDIDQAKAGVTRDYEAAGRSHGNYLGEVEKALPIIESLARIKGESEAKNDAAKAAKASGSDLSDSEMRTRLLGAAQLEQGSAVAAARKAVQANRAEVGEARSRRQASTKGRQVRRSRVAKAVKSGKLEFDDPVRRFQNVAAGSLEKGKNVRSYGKAFQIGPKKAKQTLRREKGELAEAKAVLGQAKSPNYVTSRAREIGIAEGLEPSLVYGLVGPSQEAQLAGAQQRVGAAKVAKPEAALAAQANLTPRDVAQTRSNKLYRNAKKIVDQMISEGGWTREEFEAGLRQATVESKKAGKNPVQHIYRLLTAEYADLFPSITEVNRSTKYAEDQG